MMSSDCNVKQMLTRVYEHPDTSKKLETQEILKTLKTGEAVSWVIFGDFNEILTPTEKWEDRDRLESQMEDFRDVLSVCGLHDLGFQRILFTWCNNKENEH